MQGGKARSSVDRQSPDSYSESYENIMPLAQTRGSPSRPPQKRVSSKVRLSSEAADPQAFGASVTSTAGASAPQRIIGKQHLCDSCQEATASMFCLNCQGWLCGRCDASIHQNKLFVKHERISAADYVPPVMCKHHENEVTTHICATCQELCCIYCIVGESHTPGPEHIVQSVAKGLSVVRMEMSSSLDLLQQKSSDLEKALESLKSSTDELNKSVELVQARTREGFERLRKVLNEREADLLDNIDRFKIEQSRDLHDKTQIIRAAHTGIRSLIQETTQKLQQSTGLGAVLEQVDGVDRSDSVHTSVVRHGGSGNTSSEYKLALYKAANVIKFFTMRRDELLRGKEYDTRSAIATAEILATEVVTPRRYFLDSETIREYIEGIKALEIVLAEFGFKQDERDHDGYHGH